MIRDRITKWDLARRDLLKGLGLGAAFLPLLRAPRAHAHALAPAKKLICVLAIQGYRMYRWKPGMVGELANQTLPASLAGLEPHKGDLIVATDLTSQGAGVGNAGYSTVFYGLGSTGSGGVGNTGGTWREPTGPTLDQVVASESAPPAGTRASYAFGVQLDLPPRATTVPGGLHAFWRGQGQPIVPELNPQAAYQALFGDNPTGAPSDVEKLRVQRKSVLDYVGGSLMRYAGRVGTEDKRIIEGHLAAIRTLERGFDGIATAACTTRPAAIDLNDSRQYPNVLEAHTNVMVAALACGVLRVGTLQLADAYGYSVNFAFVPGIPERSTSNYKTAFRNWADLSHNPVMNGTDDKAIVDRWWMDRLAALITRLKATPDPAGGTLFDTTTVVWANPVDDGASRNSQKMPWLVATRAGGVLKTGRYISGGSSAGVMSAICRHMGLNSPYGDPHPALV